MGLHDTGNFKIGDTLTSGELLQFKGIPSFSPEHFRYINNADPMKAKQLTNVRASGKDESIRLTPPRRMTLEQAIAYIEDDELVEVTPQNIRLRKRVLNPSFRKKRTKED